jgi:hypothetical protein
MLRLTRLLTAAGIVLLFVTHLWFRGSGSGQSRLVATFLDLGHAGEEVRHAPSAVVSDGSTGKAVPAAAGACLGSGANIFDQLELNGAARTLWGCVDRSRVQTVMLTFGSKSMSDFVMNWMEHVRRLGADAGPYLVRSLPLSAYAGGATACHPAHAARSSLCGAACLRARLTPASGSRKTGCLTVRFR